MLHSEAPINWRHPVHNWDVEDSTALAALVVSPADIGKLARQLDTGEFLILGNDDPVTWVSVGSSAIPEPGSSNYGYLNIPQVSKSEAYTLVLEDSGKHILHPAADTTARTYTIPANSSVAFPIGTAITFINDSSEDVTIAINTDTLVLAGDGSTGSRTLSQYGLATAIKIAATKWYISGTGLS